MMPYDFPKHFVDRKHPKDYILVPEPIIPQYILHESKSIRLFLHISWKAAKGYLPMTFMVDTTYRSAMSFCPEAKGAIRDNGLLHIDDSSGYAFVKVHHGRSGEDFFSVAIDYSQVKSVNILGLRGLMKLGLHFDSTGFRFDESIPWF